MAWLYRAFGQPMVRPKRSGTPSAESWSWFLTHEHRPRQDRDGRPACFRPARAEMRTGRPQPIRCAPPFETLAYRLLVVVALVDNACASWRCVRKVGNVLAMKVRSC